MYTDVLDFHPKYCLDLISLKQVIVNHFIMIRHAFQCNADVILYLIY